MPIKAIGMAVPSIRETATDIANATGADEAFIRDKVGIHTRYILGATETGLDLGEAAVRNLMEKSGLQTSDVGVVIYVTQNPDRRIPHNAAPLAHRLGLDLSVASFDLSLGCSGFVYGLTVVEAFLESYGQENAILVTCDPYSRIMDKADKATNAVFGDAATATWFQRSAPEEKLIAVDFGTDGGGADAICIDAGGAALPLVALDIDDGVKDYGREALRLHMEGRAVFNFVNKVMPLSFDKCLTNAGLSVDDIDAFALHQGSKYMLQFLARNAKIPAEKLLFNIERYGNTVSSTVPLLLMELLDNKAREPQTVLISGFGVGLSWATAVLKI